MKETLAGHLFQEELYHFTTPVVAVLPRPWDAYPADDKFLLQKILTSVQVNFSSVQLVFQESLDLPALRMYHPQKVLVFGVSGAEDIGMYEAETAQGFTVIRADDLNLLDEQKKKILWIALRQIFGV